MTGGVNSSRYLNRAEIYDPAAGKWIAIGPLDTARQFHTVTLLGNGQVLVAGRL